MKRGLTMLLVLSVLAAVTLPSPTDELPPDLTHISGTGCHLKQFSENTLNAQTGKSAELFYVEVVAFASYIDHRDDWTLPLGTFHAPDADTIPKETIDRCSEWKKKVRTEIVKEHHRMGHRLKGDS